MATGLTDFRCSDGTPYPDTWVDRRAALERVLATIERAWGGELRIVSAYRPEAFNTAIGGAQHSQHMEGRALDLQPSTPTDAAKLHAVILALQESGEIAIGGLGLYPRFVHVDTRPGSRLVRWGERGAPRMLWWAREMLGARGETAPESDLDEWIGPALVALVLIVCTGALVTWAIRRTA